MKVIVKGVYDERNIPAIKELRAATGLGLRESKEIVDDARAGAPTTVEVKDDATFVYLDVEKVEPSRLDKLVDTLTAFPRDLTVGEIVDLLHITQKLTRS